MARKEREQRKEHSIIDGVAKAGMHTVYKGNEEVRKRVCEIAIHIEAEVSTIGCVCDWSQHHFLTSSPYYAPT